MLTEQEAIPLAGSPPGLCALPYVAVASWEGPAFGSAIDYLVGLPQIGHLWTIEGYDVYAPWLLVSIAGTIFYHCLPLVWHEHRCQV